ncbi:MAG: transcriptional repressor LexA [Planctomycetota bacterium]
MPSAELTDRQQEVYDLIRTLIYDRGYGPTVREIGEQFGIKSPNGVMCHLRALERKGLITRKANKSRAIELTGSAKAGGHNPRYVGLVSERGGAIDLQSEDTVELSSPLTGANRIAVRVSGDYLVNAGINDGDTVVLELGETATNGQLVLAVVERFGTVLRFWDAGADHVELRAANAAVAPLRVDAPSIIGIAAMVFRDL